MNKRYDLDPKAVSEQIEKSIKKHEKMRIQCKASNCDITYVDPMIDNWISRERDYYSKVRVIRLPKAKKRLHYVLVYGDVDDATVTTGTGGFSTIEKAKDFFLNGGR